MNITKTSNKIFTNKILNGETINYTFLFISFSFILLALKQFFKLAIGAPASISLLVSFIVCGIALFLCEKKYVFYKDNKSKLPKQILMLGISLVVYFGFYKLIDFISYDLFEQRKMLTFIILTPVIYVFKYFFDKLIVFESNDNAKGKANGRLYKLFFNNRFVVLSMAVVCIIFLFMYVILKLYPFGKFTLLRMDLYHQYGPLFCELYDRVINHQGFIYSWTSGGGSSFLGNYFNYLSSPLSAFIFLFDRNQIATSITMLITLKGVLAAGTFTYFIKKSFKSNSYATAAFGIFYALSGYYLAYYWNLMWIDGMILLPIIALGIEKIINDNKPILYICSLTLLLFSSYYMGYMVCIFSVIYFLSYYFIHNYSYDTIAKLDKKAPIHKRILNNKFISRGLTFAFSSFICGALCAVTLIPVFFILKQCSATSDNFPSSSSMYFDFIDLISSHLSGLETTIRSSGNDVIPNIYCGILSIILLPLYVMNKKINFKEKAISIFVLIFMAICLCNNYTNFIWQAFHFPNDLPYRFSYIYVFFLLIIAFRSLQNLKEIEYRDIALVGMLWLLVIFYFQRNPNEKISDLTIYSSFAFVIVWTFVLLAIKKKIAKNTILGILIISIAFCEAMIVDGNSYYATQPNDEYVSNYDDYKDALNIIEKSDDSLYRTELCYLETRMDPCLYNYKGISTFSSMAYEKYSSDQYALGMFGNRVNSYTYNPQTPVYNMMFGIKYLMHDEKGPIPSDDAYFYIDSTDNHNVDIYQNKYYLPLAFETSSDIENAVIIEGNPFESQEELIDLAAGVSNVFIPVEYTTTSCENAYCDTITSNGTVSFTKNDNSSQSGEINFNIKSVKDSNVYIYMHSPTIKNANYYIDDEQRNEYQSIERPYIYDLGYHKTGEEISVSLDLANIEGDASYFEVYAYNIDKDVLDSSYDILKQCTLDITNYTDTKIEGTINAGYDGCLYTSIPYDDSWSIYIDGEKQDTFMVGNSMLAASINEGEHKVVFKYSPKGLKYGIVISGATWLCVIAYIIIKKAFNKKKEEQI